MGANSKNTFLSLKFAIHVLAFSSFSWFLCTEAYFTHHLDYLAQKRWSKYTTFTICFQKNTTWKTNNTPEMLKLCPVYKMWCLWLGSEHLFVTTVVLKLETMAISFKKRERERERERETYCMCVFVRVWCVEKLNLLLYIHRLLCLG